MAVIIRRWRAFVAIAVAFLAFLVYAIDFTRVDVSCNPPEVVSVSGCVVECTRIGDRLLLRLDGCEDVWLLFKGLPADEEVGYTLLSAYGSVLAHGEGCYLPVESHPSAAAVLIYSLSGETDWSDVVEVHAVTSAARQRSVSTGPVASGDRMRSIPSGGGAGAVASASGGFGIYTIGCLTSESWGGVDASACVLTGLSGFSGEYENGTGAFSTGVGGYMKLTGGVPYSFRVGADDSATLKIGTATSYIGGEHAFCWGNTATFTPAETGYYGFSVSYSNVGGPYELDFEGAPSPIYSCTNSIPYATITANPSVLTVPWNGQAPSASICASGTDSRVSYALTRSGAAGTLSGDAPSWTYTPDAEAIRRGGDTNAVFTLGQSYDIFSYDGAQATVSLVRQKPEATLSPTVVTVTRTGKGVVGVSGLYGPALAYEFADGGTEKEFSYEGSGAEDGVVSTNFVDVAWVARYGGATVAEGTNRVQVVYDLSRKATKNEKCLCEVNLEGSKPGVENACVSFTQRFGSTPWASSAPWGVLAIEEEEPTQRLATPAVLRYDHPAMRRLAGGASGTAVVWPPLGHPLTYENGVPSQNSVTHDSRLVEVAGAPVPTVREVFPDRSEVVYTNGVPAALVTSDGVRVEVADLGIEVIRDSNGYISQIWSWTDGLLDVTVYSGRFRVNWYAPSAVGTKNAAGVYTYTGSPLKYFDFGTPSGGTTGRSFSLVEHRSADMEFPTRWDWDATVQDWTMVRGSGSEAVTLFRSIADNADGTWTVTTSSTSAQGTAKSDTKTYSGRNGNAVVAATSGGRQTYAASRVDAGDGVGRPCSTTDALGLLTTNIYDSAGRIVYSATSGGAVERTTFYEYPSGGVTPDFTPSRTIHVAGGVTNRIDTYTRAGTREDGLVEISAVSDGLNVRTNLTIRHPAASVNIFEAGRVALMVAPDGATTTNEYEAAEGFLYVRTSTRGVFSGGAFSLVEGKSTRTRDFYDAQGNIAVTVSEALVGGQWREIASATNTYNVMHTRLGTIRSTGKFSDSSRICTGPLWTLGEDGIATTNQYDSTKRMVASTRYGPFGAVATAYTLDAQGRVVAEIRTADGVESQTVTRTYDTEGRLTSETDAQGLVTTYAYSADGKVTTVTFPSGGTRITTLNADGTLASVTGTAVTPEYYSYGVTTNGLEWTQVNYLSRNGARWTKTYRNAFGETVRDERPGANGSTLTTEYTYNEKGQLVSTVSTGQPAETRTYDIWGDLASVTQSADGKSRTQSMEGANALVGGEVWRVESSALSCSDAAIAPLVTTNMTQLSGLSLTNESRQVSIDIRGNASEIWSEFDPEISTRLTHSTIPTATNAALSESMDGVATLSVSYSAVTNLVAYDAYRRVVVQTDGRGNATTNAYDALGRLASVTDAATNTTWYAYDAAGRLAAVTNALGVATVYEYDLRGNKTYEGGGTYPVTYAYDAFNVMTNMTTYRAEGSLPGDVTTWLYDEATGLVTNKVYADGYGPSYTYTDNGNLATRTWARGVVTTYAYDGWNNLTNTAYSDGTPSIALSYDAMGRQVSAMDAVGTTTTTYDDYAEVASEIVSGLYSRTISHVRDAYGRDLGYTTGNSRMSIVEYEADTARMKRVKMAGVWFTYYYLSGTDLKSRLQYGSSGSAYYTYEPHRDLLTQVQNYINGGVISQYDYVNDALGRRTEISRSGSMMSETRTDYYGYNDRSELVSGIKDTAATNITEYAYQYDDIGNRIESLDLGTNRTYTANALNQYTNIVEGAGGFLPQFDNDGNQTLIRTSTGDWSVTYNGENRPVNWSCGNTNIVMKFDRMGRRVEYIETVSGVTNAHHRFVYDGYVCIQRLNGAANNSIDLVFGWDPSEPVATRPLVLQKYGQYSIFYTHDGNKNVSELVFFQQANGIAAHYEYAPFGAVTATTSSTPVMTYDFREYNPFRFSSEYADNALGLMYYNYRHYEPCVGRWHNCDLLGEENGMNLYMFCDNAAVCLVDSLGNVPTGTTFLNAYSPYDYSHNGREIWSAVGGSLKRHLWNDETVYPPNSCATRVTIALIKSNEPIPNGSRQYINTLKRGEQGIAGNYIVGAGKMQDYLTSAWGTTSKLSPSSAYYFVSKVKKGDISGLREEIEEKLKCSNVPTDEYVCVVSSKVNDEPGVSGHIGMVTKTYADRYTPYRDNPAVWILPPTIKVTPQKK